MYLEKILERKRVTVGELAHGAAERQTRIRHARPPRDFAASLSRLGMSLIAEIKPRSPSCGEFGRAAEPLNLAIEYQASGASAVSVLADCEFFGGGPELVERVANHGCIGIPILYKDFVIDPQQVFEARACGADAVLLIARAVEPELLRELVQVTHKLGMDALVETFDESDVEAALEAGAAIIGVNNRDLETFHVNMTRSTELAGRIPAGIIKVSESGVKTRSDVLHLERAGFSAILVGESLLVSPDLGGTIAELLGH